jgi:hypothetical protein
MASGRTELIAMTGKRAAPRVAPNALVESVAGATGNRDYELVV